jgi:hypothetical protein
VREKPRCAWLRGELTGFVGEVRTVGGGGVFWAGCSRVRQGVNGERCLAGRVMVAGGRSKIWVQPSYPPQGSPQIIEVRESKEVQTFDIELDASDLRRLIDRKR